MFNVKKILYFVEKSHIHTIVALLENVSLKNYVYLKIWHVIIRIYPYNTYEDI